MASTDPLPPDAGLLARPAGSAAVTLKTVSAPVRGLDLLAACARRHFAAASGARAVAAASDALRALAASGAAWHGLPALARRHGVAPLAAAQLSAACPAAPPTILAALREQARQQAEGNALRTRVLFEALRAFERERIPALVLKGPALAVQAFGDPVLRSFSDVDLLVRRQDLVRVTSVLAAAGYRPDPALPSPEPKAFADYLSECRFVHASKPALEVHWRLLPRGVSHAVVSLATGLRGEEDPWDRVESVRLGGRFVLAPAREELLLYLCVHGSRHVWQRLGWVCDVAGLVAARPQLHWSHIIERAGQYGTRRMLFLGLALARELAGVEPPPAVVQSIQEDAAVSRVLTQVRGWISSDEAAALPLRKKLGFELDASERPLDRAGRLLHRALAPAFVDLRLLSRRQRPAW